MALRKVKLYGKLGKLFGSEWELDVSSVGEAIRAIDVNTNGAFRDYFFSEGRDKKYKVAVKKKDNLLSKEEINAPFGNGDIYLMPTTQGAGKVGMIILGVVLIAAAVITGGTSLAAWNAWQFAAFSIGTSLVLGGVMQLIAPSPGIDNSTEESQRASTFFQGNASTIYQGGSVGVAYGRVLVNPMPIMLSFNAQETQSTSSTYDGNVETVTLPDGSIEYVSASKTVPS